MDYLVWLTVQGVHSWLLCCGAVALHFCAGVLGAGHHQLLGGGGPDHHPVSQGVGLHHQPGGGQVDPVQHQGQQQQGHAEAGIKKKQA